jgi:uracil-DNA glycosylase family 4
MTKAEKKEALDDIAKEIEACAECKHDKVGRAVPGEGNPNADVMFVGEAPGKTEAETGRPFVGRSGKVLRSLIQAMGYNDPDVYITSPVKRLPTYTTPNAEDIAHGRLHLDKQIAIIEPKYIVLLGNVACQAVLGEKLPISKEHGKIIERGGLHYFVSYHPAAGLYAPAVRPEIVADFNKLRKLLRQAAPN